jgi:hypothetical protein
VNHNVSLPEPISLKPIGTAIRGCVTLKDGTPAVRTAVSPYQTADAAEVSAVNGAGQVLAGPVPVNAAGCYVLPGVPDIPDLNVGVRYEHATARQAVPAGALASIVNVVLPNAPPTITAFTATFAGTAVYQVPPGSTVTAKVEAMSPENYPLHYKWADGTGASLLGDQASEQWHLPKTNSLNFLFVEVSDLHGGVARASLPILTGTAAAAGQNQGRTTPAGAPQRFNAITPPHKLATPAFQHPGNTFIDPTLFMPCSDTASCAAVANTYYQSLGVVDATGKPTGSYVNFKTWKAAWGFSDDPTIQGPVNETRAVFYNNGDLQFGRDMHCLAKVGLIDPATEPITTVNVCYVTNFSDPSGAPGGNPQTAVFDAGNNFFPIATVAMVGITQGYRVPIGNDRYWINVPYVYFLVFVPNFLGDFVPNPTATLDSEGSKAVPGVCIACHGGTYSSSSNDVAGAKFLPFDTSSYIYDQGNSAFSAAFQSDAFRVLNIIVRNTDTDGEWPGPISSSVPSQTIRDLIAGWYSWCGGVDTPGCSIDDVNYPFIPDGNCASADAPATCGWTNNGLFALAYQQISRVVCRTCHIAHSDVFNGQNFLQFQARAPLVCSVINSHFMPFAEVPYNRFWASSIDQSALAALLGNVSASCQFNPPPR